MAKKIKMGTPLYKCIMCDQELKKLKAIQKFNDRSGYFFDFKCACGLEFQEKDKYKTVKERNEVIDRVWSILTESSED